MAEENAAQNLTIADHESPLIDADTIKEELMVDLDDVERLTFSSALNPILRASINRVTGSFQRRVAHLLSPVRRGQTRPFRDEIVPSEELSDLGFADLDNLEEISGLDHLLRARTEIRHMIERVLADPRYQTAAKSYRLQSRSPEARDTLYRFLAHAGFHEHQELTAGQTLYHGISLGEFGDQLVDAGEQEKEVLLSSTDYFEKITAISRTGLIAAPAPENLPLLESIFCVSDIRNAYGLAAMAFPKPAEEKLWGRSKGAAEKGLQLVKPKHTGPIQLLLRSPAFYDALEGVARTDIFGQVSRKEYTRFLDSLQKHLASANLAYHIVEPDGSTSKAA